MQIKHLNFYIMGENAISTKQTEEEWGKTKKEKLYLKETFQPCLYFGNFCGGGRRIENLYINIKNQINGF